SPTTTTPTRARRGASSGTASVARRRALYGLPAGLRVRRALHPQVFVDAAVELERSPVARHGEGELRRLVRRQLLVHAELVGRERVRGVSLVLELDGDLLAR